jgi:hypothetical protein
MMSPGGNTPSASCNCPDDPPVSNIVTMACTSTQGLAFSPPSTLGKPVPPPKHPTASSRMRICAILRPAPRYN